MNVCSKLKAGADLSAHIDQISATALASDGDSTISVKYTYNRSTSSSYHSSMPLTHLTTALNGYCAKLTGTALDAVRSDPNVEYVQQDHIFASDDNSTISTTPVFSSDDESTNSTTGPLEERAPSDRGLLTNIYVVGKTRRYAGCLY
jgi:hypothetical protein